MCSQVHGLTSTMTHPILSQLFSPLCTSYLLLLGCLLLLLLVFCLLPYFILPFLLLPFFLCYASLLLCLLYLMVEGLALYRVRKAPCISNSGKLLLLLLCQPVCFLICPAYGLKDELKARRSCKQTRSSLQGLIYIPFRAARKSASLSSTSAVVRSLQAGGAVNHRPGQQKVWCGKVW